MSKPRVTTDEQDKALADQYLICYDLESALKAIGAKVTFEGVK